MTYSYAYPHPAVTTDIVVFTVENQALKVLLIQRKEAPFAGQWALPGGFLAIDESIDACAARELEEETGVSGIYLEQLYTFGAPDRDPRERVLSVAYYALMPLDDVTLRAGSDATAAGWYDVDDLPRLAFDHGEIIAVARDRLTAKMDYSTVGLMFMPGEFTLSEVQSLYEIVSGQTRDKRNFRKWLLGLDILEETGGKKVEGAHRPAMLYRLKDKSDVVITR
ncbi:NUDIX domain-containing protein [Pyruvatibacter sp.]|uniref:NUDIX hydrolase n=1 Tax=Pyruvatibacter sp. TaxID=1981328 RepID=UPI0032660D7B